MSKKTEDSFALQQLGKILSKPLALWEFSIVHLVHWHGYSGAQGCCMSYRGSNSAGMRLLVSQTKEMTTLIIIQPRL